MNVLNPSEWLLNQHRTLTDSRTKNELAVISESKTYSTTTVVRLANTFINELYWKIQFTCLNLSNGFCILIYWVIRQRGYWISIYWFTNNLLLFILVNQKCNEAWPVHFDLQTNYSFLVCVFEWIWKTALYHWKCMNEWIYEEVLIEFKGYLHQVTFFF